MLTIFTGDSEMPAVFVAFDQIVSQDPSFTKTFLLHTEKEPTVDTDNKTAVVTNGEGRMYVTSVFGADEIVKIGGEGKAWWINGYYEKDGTWVEGKNLADLYHPDDNSDAVWGRIELRAAGTTDTELLTVMGITDTTSDKTPKVEGFKNDSVYGVKIDENIVVFVNSTERNYKEFSFETSGSGLYDYYLSGIEGGTWQVLVDGVSVAYALSEDDGGFIHFVAPAGEVTLKPGADVIGENGGRIQYVTGGAVLPADAPFSYRTDLPQDLPTEVIRGNDIFLGWYTSPDYDEATRVTKTPTENGGKLVLYARWFSNYLDEDYIKTNVSSSTNQTVNGVTVQDAALRIYGMRVQEGNEFEGKAIPQTEGIKYNTNGARLPKDAKKDFNTDGSATPLPEVLEKSGYIFMGWYTSPTFEENTKTLEAPAGSSGLYEVYAGWFELLVDESYDKNSVAVRESYTSVIGGISYNAGHSGDLKPGSTFYTEKDGASGNTYLKASVVDSNSIITVTSDGKNYSTLKETAVSFRLDIGAAKDIPLSGYSVRLRSNDYGYRALFSVNGATGEIKLGGSANVIGTVTAGSFVTVRITVDFVAQTLAAYGEGGEILDTVPLGELPTPKTGYDKPSSWAEWQRLAANYLFYGIQSRPSAASAGTETSVLLDNLQIIDGRAFAQ